MILTFAVNKKQKNFFEKIKKYSKCKVDVLYSKNILSFSIKSFKYLKKVDFSKAVDLRVKDFYATYEKNIPSFILKFYYNFLAYFSYFRYFSKIDNRYKKVVVWNGFMFRQAIVLEIAKIYNISPIFIETAFLPNRIVVDNKGVNFYNSVPRNRNFFENYSNDLPLPDNLIPRQPRNAKKFASLKKEKLPEKFIFIPFQVDYDTQILLFSKWVKSMTELFDIVESIAKELKINFIFKEHPSSKKEYPKLHQRVSKYIQFANGYPTQELIQKSDAVITINSSVGIESLLFDKKVILLGDAFYDIDGIVKKANSIEELKSVLINLENWKIDKELIENFLKYLYYEYLIEGNFKDFNEIQMKKIDRILECE